MLSKVTPENNINDLINKRSPLREVDLEKFLPTESLKILQKTAEIAPEHYRAQAMQEVLGALWSRLPPAEKKYIFLHNEVDDPAMVLECAKSVEVTYTYHFKWAYGKS